MADVEGVGAVGEPVPELGGGGNVYHKRLVPAAVKLAVEPWQNPAGVVTDGADGTSFTVIVTVALGPSQLLIVSLT